MGTTRTTPTADRHGFTLVELAIVLIITSILIGVAVPRIQSTFHQRDVDGARDGVMLMAAQARARAMATSKVVKLRFEADDGYAQMVEGTTVVETFNFEDDLGVEATSGVGDFVMCYTARGFAIEPCSTHLTGPAIVTFERDGHDAALEVWQLGQLRKL